MNGNIETNLKICRTAIKVLRDNCEVRHAEDKLLDFAVQQLTELVDYVEKTLSTENEDSEH